MRFHICTLNHLPGSQETLQEQVIWLTEGLTKLGHEVTYSGSAVDHGAINVFWESFHPNLAEGMVQSGLKYAIMATEIPDGKGWNNEKRAIWRKRWKGFEIAAKGAQFVWSLIPEAVPVYQKMGAKACYLEYGYAEGLRMESKPSRDIDFFFYGGCGGHRQNRINDLANAGFTALHPGQILPADIRDAMMQRSKVILGLKYHEGWRFTSASRIGRAILADCAVAHEWAENVLRPAHLVPMMPKGGDWVEFCAQVVKHWKLHAEAALERYRIEMPIKHTTERALEGVL